MATKESLFEKYLVLQSLLTQLHHQKQHDHPRGRQAFADTSRGQGRVLALLKIKDGLSTKELAEVLGLRVSSLNETLSRMEKTGMVERRPSEKDKRVMLVYLTEEGRSQQQEESNSNLDELLLKGFSEEDLEAMESYFTRMIANLEEELGSEAVAQVEELWRKRSEMMECMKNGEQHFGGRPPMPSANGAGREHVAGFPGFGTFGNWRR